MLIDGGKGPNSDPNLFIDRIVAVDPVRLCSHHTIDLSEFTIHLGGGDSGRSTAAR